MYSSDSYALCPVEEIVYKHCQYYKSNPTQPCWGRVTKDTVSLPSFKENPEGIDCYLCKGHWKCIVGGLYEKEFE